MYTFIFHHTDRGSAAGGASCLVVYKFPLQNERGNTPVYISSQTFRPAITRLLLEAGADVSMICMLGFNSLGFAATKGYFL